MLIARGWGSLGGCGEGEMLAKGYKVMVDRKNDFKRSIVQCVKCSYHKTVST
jgi:hypothetical protein